MSDDVPDSIRHSRDPRIGEESLLPDDWEALAPLVDAVLDAPLEHRAQVLAEVSAGDLVRRAAVERLVAECEGKAPMLDRPAAERFSRLLLDEVDISLPEMLGGRYRIQRELGRGGMACVYLARDTKHARDVAVKVIRPDVAASLGRDRFLREIGIAARLRHPNIVPLYDSGDADGVLYFVMPYEEGPSLRERLASGQELAVGECVSALRDIARALVYAHEHGVVHRDVKPDNVMMSGGAAVVTDFGIAKAVSVAQADSPSGTITQAGAGIGTPAYMAPEQAIGDPSTDHRADIYSFGCLAYELFAGHPPFHDLPTHQIIAAHMGTKPVPLSEIRAGVPDSVGRLVARCLQKHPDARPQTAQELLAELEGSQTGPNEALHRRRPFPSFRVALVIAGLLVLGGAGYIIARGRATSTNRPAGELTLAVLPLNSRGGDSTLVDMADALSDEVATALVNVAGLRIMSRSTVGKYRGLRDVMPQKVGKELGAQLLVMGGLRGNARRFTATVRLVNANDQSDLWAHTYDRSDGDFSALREDIVRAIEQTLRTKFTGAVGSRAIAQRRTHTESPEVHRLYMAGLSKLRQRNIPASVEFFRQATQADTLLANAYSGLSVALALTPYFQDTPSREVATEAIATARRALSLDSTLAQPHVALGLVYHHAYDWDRAGAELDTAIRLRSEDDVEPLIQYGRYLLFRGRIDDAQRQFLAARSTEPASALVSSWVSYTYYVRGQLDSALAEISFALESDSTNMTTLLNGALVNLKAGRSAAARDLARRSRRLEPVALYVLAAVGDTSEAMTRLREVERGGRNRWRSQTMRAYAMLGVGDTTAAMAALERATDLNENWPSLQSSLDPMFDPLRGSARYQALLRRVGLPSVSVSAPAPPTAR